MPREDLSIQAPEARAVRARLSPAVSAILWLDGVLLVAGLLALIGMWPALDQGASGETWMALGGAVLTAALGALAAFELAEGASAKWLCVPMPGLFMWAAGSALGCGSAYAWGGTPEEVQHCFVFLFNVSLPLLALILFMLWRARAGAWAMAMGALAAAGAAASLLAIVHPHDMAPLDLGAHAGVVVVALAISAAVSQLPRRVT